MKIKKFNLKEFENLDRKKWALGNKILYNMCSSYPLHTESEEIRAKIWLIGRSYAAAIERRKTKQDINDNFYDVVIKEFIQFNKEKNLDGRLEKLKSQKFNEECLNEMLLLHYDLTRFFFNLTKLEKRSLASKYLHFHSPIFPIYDTRAKDSINKVVKGNIKIPKIIGDKEYSKFCHKILFLYNYIKEMTGGEVSLRDIDRYLVSVANKNLNEKKIKQES